ncbi:hypothetical protein B0H13DRAFT_2305161 [Mycena leptocephala]|nr:hypothetical protein B0H13DRAFT_2305161 [Mycena leptocephala]
MVWHGTLGLTAGPTEVPPLMPAITAADIRAAALDDGGADDGDEWEDEVEVSSRPLTLLSGPPSPLSDPPTSRPPSPLSSLRSSSPLSELLASRPPTPDDFSDVPLLVDSRRLHQRRGAAGKRKRERITMAQAAQFGPAPKSAHSQVYREQAPHTATFNARDLPSSSARLSRRKIRQLKALLDRKYDYIEWNGRCGAHFTCPDTSLTVDPHPKLILDAEGRIVAILLGRLEGTDWDEVIAEMEHLMEHVRWRGLKRGVFKAKYRKHRRGSYFLVGGGVSMGGGQKRPGMLVHSKEYRKLLHHIATNKSIRRIAGFQSSGVARYLPKLYRYLCTTMKGIYDNQPDLKQLFPNSVFPAATWNLGPDVVTAEHCDMHNPPHSVCPITSAGNYDHKKGGHIYMKQIKTVIEFPSARRDALLYDPTAKSLLATEGGAEKKALFDGEPGARAAWAVELFSKMDELEGDRRAVFGEN